MNPVLKKDLGGLSRRPLVLVFLTLMLVGLTTLITASWPIGDNLTPDEISQRGQTLWQYSTLIQLAFIALLSPAISAPALSSERRSGTFTLVMLSGLHPLSFALAKLGARFLVIALAVLLPFPILLTAATLGGTDFTTAFQTITIILTLGLFASALGLFFSAMFDQDHRSIFASYLCLSVPVSLPLLLPAFGLTQSALQSSRFGLWEAFISPYSNLRYVSNPSAFSAQELFARYFWVQPLLYSLASALLILLSWPLIARSLKRDSDWRKNKRSLVSRALGKLLEIGQWRQRLSQNPIYWRETSLQSVLRFRNSHRFNFYALLATLVLLILNQFPASSKVLEQVVAGISAPSPSLKVHSTVIALLLGIISLATTVTATVSIGRERQSGLMQQLAVTPLRFNTFFVGKALGISQNLILLLSLPLIYACVMGLQGEVSILTWPLLLAAVPLIAFFSIIQGLFCALAAENQTRALVMALFLLAMEAFGAFCNLWSFNPAYFGYLIVVNTDVTMAGGDKILFLVLTLVSFVAHIFALYTLSKWLRASFDRFLGRVGTMELQVESAS